MTHDEVKELLQPYREQAECGARQGFALAVRQVAAFNYALQAIEDRAVMANVNTTLTELGEARERSRRHMKGEP